MTVIEDRGPAGEEIEAVPPADREAEEDSLDDENVEDAEISAEDAEIDANEPDEPAAAATA